ncbi:hypothetical protein D3C80_2048030 [compost metagenome]
MAELGDHPGQDAGGDMAMTPDLVQQFIATDQLAGPAQQHQQHRERLRLDRLRQSRARQGMRGRVDHDVVESVTFGG